MNSPQQNDQKSQQEESKAPAGNRPNKPISDDDQNPATIEEFDEEGMGVAPKE